jgi:hypothetical protein
MRISGIWSIIFFRLFIFYNTDKAHANDNTCNYSLILQRDETDTRANEKGGGGERMSKKFFSKIA